MKKSLTILQLYPRDMNIYGDRGNTLALKKRAEQHGLAVTVVDYNPGDSFPKNIDIIIGGGGQDSGQEKIKDDLLAIKDTLHELANNGVPMLLICGLYQLFGKYFKTQTGHTIDGIGLLDITTVAGPERLIGNIVIQSEQFGEIIGYENHSGQTYLGVDIQPLGQVIIGAGNNSRDGVEGATYKNVIGSYMHGSLLPKNPAITDWLIEKAAINKYSTFTPATIDDHIIKLARKYAKRRPR